MGVGKTETTVEQLQAATHVFRDMQRNDEWTPEHHDTLSNFFHDTHEGMSLQVALMKANEIFGVHKALEAAFAVGYALRIAEERVMGVQAGDCTCVEHHQLNCPECGKGGVVISLNPTD